MSIEVWRVSSYSATPTRRTFARETGSFYFTDKGRREKKESDWYQHYASEQDAINAIRARDDAAAQAAAKRRIQQCGPDLLEALEAAVECGMVPTSSANEGGANRFPRQVHVADQIRAAIAKARGAA